MRSQLRNKPAFNAPPARVTVRHMSLTDYFAEANAVGHRSRGRPGDAAGAGVSVSLGLRTDFRSLPKQIARSDQFLD